MTSPTGIMTSQPLFQNTVILRRPGVAIFADIIKIITRFIRKTQEKLKELEICIKMQSMSVFFDVTKFADFWCKMLMSAEIAGCVKWLMYFLDLF